MSSSSDLTTSGLLYEGNFDDWLPRMRAILSQHHRCSITSHDGQPLSVSGEDSRKKKADTIWGQVSPYVRARVSKTSRQNPDPLIRALREIARPFRFMELPPEIRSRIFSFVIPSQVNTWVELAMTPNDRVRMHCNDKDQGSILCISQQIRAEALPLYYISRRFALIWRDLDYPLNTTQQTSEINRRERRVKRDPGELGIEIKKSINKWAHALRPDTLKSLRHATLILKRPNRKYQGIRCFLMKFDGKLEIKCRTHEDWLSQESFARLNDHAASVSGVATDLRLEGEALMLFLASCPEIWDRMPELQE